MAHRIGNKFNLKHGHACGSAHSKTYCAWVDMRRRCEKSDHKAYKWYGARGISVCERWQKFPQFLADMGNAPSGSSLDRINNDGNYEPGNCRWATAEQQSRNRRGVGKIEIGGVKFTVSALSKFFLIGETTIRERLKRGWLVKDALTRDVEEKHACK